MSSKKSTLRGTPLPIVHIGESYWEHIGKVLVAVSRLGVVSLAMGDINMENFTLTVQKRGIGLVEDGVDYSAQAVQQLNEYFAGERKNFNLLIDYRGMTEFQKGVYGITSRIPAGKTYTYLGIAEELENPKAVRAVGQALANNPIPIIIPCHRVISKQGTLQGYSAGKGIATKTQLLKLEGAMLL